MRNSEVPPIPPQEGEHVIMGSLNILVEGKNGLRSRDVLLVANNQEGAEHPFRAIDPKTEEEVELTPTRIHDAYISAGLKPPENAQTKNVGRYYGIRIGKKKELLRKAKAQANSETK